nr:hypothetical protein [Tanacetum cinerariifolium]
LMIAKDGRCFVDTSKVTTGTACLLNEAIFEGLARMGAKTTAWNEFSSTMVSAIICLADNQKFNFSNLQEHVLDLQEAKDAQAKEIAALKKKEDASKQGRMIKEIDQNVEIALEDETQGITNDDEMFRVDDLAREEVVIKTTTGVKDSVAPTTYVTEDEVIMAQALAALKSTKPKVVVQEQETSTTIIVAAKTVTTAVLTPRAKGKAKMIEPEVPIQKKDQMRIDEECARKLEAEKQEAARLSRAQQDEKANNS